MIFTQLKTEPKNQSFNSMMDELRIAKIRQKLIEHDNAFLNSFLSHAVYTGRQWTLGLIKNHPDQTSGNFNALTKFKSIIQESEENMTPRKAYEIYISTYLRNTFELVDLPVKSGEYKSKAFGYKTQVNFKNGDYEALDNLARAGIFRSNNRDGTYTLHVAFRGTDTGARSFFDFVKYAYTDVASYSDCFKPLEKALIEYVNNPENKIKNVHLSGHSLGGAPAQIMLDSLKNNAEFNKANVNIKAYTYGAIGGFSYLWNKVVTCLYHAATKGSFTQFKNLGITALQSLNLYKTPSHEDICRYKHAGDLIPIVGSMGYDNKGAVYDLRDFSGENTQSEISVSGIRKICANTQEFEALPLFKKAKVKLFDNPVHHVKTIFTLGFHDMLRYVRNIDAHINDISLGVPELKDENLTPRFEEFKIYTARYNKVTNTEQNKISRNMFNNYKINNNIKPIIVNDDEKFEKVLSSIKKMRKKGFVRDLEKEITETLMSESISNSSLSRRRV